MVWTTLVCPVTPIDFSQQSIVDNRRVLPIVSRPIFFSTWTAALSPTSTPTFQQVFHRCLLRFEHDRVLEVLDVFVDPPVLAHLVFHDLERVEYG